MRELKRVPPNKGIEKEYKRKLNKLVQAMSASVMYWVLADFGNRTANEMANAIRKRVRQWDKIFGKDAERIAQWFVKSVQKQTETGMSQAFNDVGRKMKPTPMHVVKAIEMENVELIKSIPQKYFIGIREVALLSLMYGWTKEKLNEELVKRKGIVERRIKNIASDQTHKTTELIKVALCENNKIRYARWKYTYRSETPRISHIEVDGAIFDISKGCLIDGEYWLPAEAINCYHKDTEIMTKDGFKKFTELSKDDEILTLNPETKEIEYSRIKHFIKKYAEDIAHIKGQTLDMCVDPNHTFFTYREVDHEKYRSVEPEFVNGIQNLKTKARFYKSCIWNAPKKEKININGLEINTDTFCKFMGYYLSDGSYNHTRGGNQIYIARKKGYKQDIEFNDLIELNPKRGVGGIYIFNKSLCDYVRKFGYSYEKYIPDEIKTLDKEHIRLFLDAYAFCDGTSKKETVGGFYYKNVVKYNSYFTSSKKLADGLVECILKTGMGASYRFDKRKGKVQKFRNGYYEIKTDLYSIFELKKQNDQLLSAKITYEKYNDFVYDIEVEKNHTLLTRFNKCIIWNGNCKCDFVPLIEEYDDDMRAEIEKNVYYRRLARWN